MFLDVQKDEITYTWKLKFNESIQNLDTKKLMKNAEEIVNLFRDPIMDGLDIFGGSRYDDDEWDDEWNDEFNSDYPEMTDEEFVELRIMYAIRSYYA